MAYGFNDNKTKFDLNAILENFGTVETGNTASQAYAAGDLLVYGSQLCKVSSPIAQGDTLAVGTNIEEITIADVSVMPPDFSQHSWKANWTTDNGTYEADYTIPLSGWYMFHMIRLSESVGGAQLMISPASDHYAFIVVLGAECKSVTLTSQWLYFTAGDQIHIQLTGDSDTRCDLAYAPCM